MSETWTPSARATTAAELYAAFMDALANARTQMIATLYSFRDMLKDLGGGLGVTDPVSGPVVLALK